MSESKRKHSLQDPTVDLPKALSCLQALKEDLDGIEETEAAEEGLGTLTKALLVLENAVIRYLRWNTSTCLFASWCYSFRNG